MPDDFDEFDDSDFELTPEMEAELKCAMQDMHDGFSYLMLEKDGKLTGEFQCNKCGRVGKPMEKPFPHKLNSPMRRGY